MRNVGMKLRSAIVPMSAVCAIVSSSHAANWVGGNLTAQAWETGSNWDGGIVPDATIDATVDGNTGVATTLIYTMNTATARQVKDLVVNSGDTLTINKSTVDGTSMTINGSLSNSGTLNFGGSGTTSNHGNSFGVTVLGSGGTINGSGATLTLDSLTSFRRSSIGYTIPANNTNAGNLYVRNRSSQGGSKVRLALSGSGLQTFTNNGSIFVEGRGTDGSSGTGTPPTAHVGPSTASEALTFGGSGSITLNSRITADTRLDSYAMISGLATGTTLTNGASHTIQGNGYIGSTSPNGNASGNTLTLSLFSSITNKGLIRAQTSTGSNWTTPTLFTASPLTNDSGARMLASSGATLSIGGASFTNNGLLEARSGGSVAVTSALPTFNGTIAGAGTFTSALPLSSTAIFSPGDLSNTDGTGTSTIGTLTVDNTLALGSAANFQIGPSSYDKTLVNTVTNATGPALTFDGTLNVATLGLVTYADGQVYDLFDWGTNTAVGGTFDSIALPTLPSNLQWKSFSGQQFDYATGQIVVEATPEPTGLALFGLIGAGLLRRNQKRNAVRLVEESNA